MGNIFISYRRGDTNDIAQRIYEQLVARYGMPNVFMDVSSIPPGTNFSIYRQNMISQSDVMLVVIGSHWLTTTDHFGRHRLDNPVDFIRMEIEQAFQHGIPVIPVLVADGRIPPAERLPTSLSPLVLSQSATVRDDSFPFDMERLFATIETTGAVDPVTEHATGPTITQSQTAGDDDFQVTAFYPKEARVNTLENILLVYAHIVSALTDVRNDALNFKYLLGDRSKETSSVALGPIPPGTEISLVPKLSGVRFDPDSVSFRWAGSWHRAIFRFEPSTELANDVARGEIEVYATTDAGRLMISRVRLAMSFEGMPTSPLSGDARTHPAAESSGFRFQSIFASYAHEDFDVVRDCYNAYQALGITMHIDYLSLLSGQYFAPTLMKMIDASDLFQLYWSPRAAASSWVRQEWEYALTCDREEGFIRPLYWEDPLPTVPLQLGRLHFARLEH